MVHSEWKGKIGYGDIISPISYAHNLSARLNEPVLLTFHWDHPPLTLTYPEDPESIEFRANFMFAEMQAADVAIAHQFNSTKVWEDSARPHTNYEYVGDMHNLWYPVHQHQQTNDRILISPSTLNSEQFPKHKKWKDPSVDQWDRLIEFTDAEAISYKTPIANVYDMMSNCKGFIGYHGSVAWIARHLRVPMIIVSGWKELAEECFPGAVVVPSITQLTDIDKLLEQSKARTIQQDKLFKRFKFHPNALKRLNHE